MSDRRYTCIIDSFKYLEKPIGCAQSITSRIKDSGNEMRTLKEICDAVGEGRTIVPFRFEAHRSKKIKGKLNQYFKGTNLIVLDIDQNMSLEEMLQIHEDIGIMPNAYYESFSHTQANHKFRVIYCLPFMLDNPEEYRLVWNTFNKFYKEGTVLDKTFDISRMYYGTRFEPVIVSEEPFDLVKLADKLGTLLTTEDYTSSYDSFRSKPKFVDANLVPEDITNQLIKIPLEDMLKSETVRMFENCELDREGDYHVLRSLMFVYHYMGHFSRFLDLAPRNKSKFSALKWSHDLKADLAVGRTGHTDTYSILKEIGAIDKAKEQQNKGVIESNYLSSRLEVLQCYKELDIPVGDYLPSDKVDEIIALAEKGNKVLMIADTGTGKTYTVINSLKRLGIKGVISVPNRMNAQQNAQTYGIAGAFAGHSLREAMLTDKVISTVWEMMSYGEEIDYHEHILINDEAHAHIHDNGYRGKSIRGVQRVAPRFKGVVDITATPTGLDLTQYTHIFRFDKKSKVDYKVKVYVGFNESSRLSIMSESLGKCLILENNKKNLAFYKDQLGEEECSIVTSDDKETNKDYLSIANNERVPEDTKFLLCTSVLTAGVNILNEDVTDIVIIGFKNVTTIKQFIARTRNVSTMNVHIFISEGSRDWYTFNIYEERAFEASILEKRVREIENNIDRDLLDTKSSLRANKLIREGLLVEEDYMKLDESVWRKYYQHLSIGNFVLALEEFFTGVEVYMKKYEMDEKAKEFKETLAEEIVVRDLMQLFERGGVLESHDDSEQSEEFSTELGVRYCLGFLEINQKTKFTKSYKRLRVLYPDLESYNLKDFELIDSYSDLLSDYSELLGEGLNHNLAIRCLREEIDLGDISAQVTASMFLADRSKYKRDSPAYVLMETISDRLPKDQEVPAEYIRELCSRIEGREFRPQDRFSNTIKEISKVVPIKKIKGSDAYQVSNFEFNELLDSETLSRMTKVRESESVDREVRDSRTIRKRWLTLAREFRRID